ncbi:MAG TPA: hypothetical protein VGA52_01765 [Anaerolineales bacterium]|jgi:hypothetical protein
MFDDLRNLSDSGDYFEEQDPFEDLKENIPQTPIFGMTAGQRFVISLLLLLTVVVMGVMALLVTTRVWLF